MLNDKTALVTEPQPAPENEISVVPIALFAAGAALLLLVSSVALLDALRAQMIDSWVTLLGPLLPQP